MEKKEIFITVLIFFIGLSLIIFQAFKTSPLFIVVEVENKEVMRIDLRVIKEKKTFYVDGLLGRSYFEYDPKKGVRMISSPCPDKLCIKQGWINKEDSAIVCLPNRVVIRLEK